LSKTPGVKPAELSHRKLDKILQSHGKITKDDVLKLARENPAPKLYESVGQDLTDEQLLQKADEVAHGWGYDDYYKMPFDLQRKADDMLESIGTQYSDYKLPGGENYREIKMRLPHFSEEDSHKLMKLEADQRHTDPAIWNTLGDAYQLKQLQAKKAALGDQYLSSHWKGEPNVLAHMRVSDRTGPEGQKVLHVEEIQSDWHQEGRKHGYKGEYKGEMAEYQKMLKEFESGANWDEGKYEKFYELQDKLGGGIAAESLSQVPDAPFKKNWHELAMKRLLNYAADNGYDSIAITPGAEQAERYNLSKHIDNVVVNPYRAERGEYSLQAVDKNGKPVIDKNNVQLNELDDYIGKELADRARQQLIDKGTSNLSGVDLQVGGEGMKGFYDQMLPTYLNQFGKKHGAQVGTINIPIPPKDSTFTFGYPGAEDYVGGRTTWNEFLAQNPKASEEFSVPVHHFPITPEMREEIATKGFPLYRKGGTVNIEQEYKLKKLRK
jgi:hypothetical protein